MNEPKLDAREFKTNPDNERDYFKLYEQEMESEEVL